MGITSEEIKKIIKKHIAEFKTEVSAEEIGIVVESGDGIAHITGLPSAMAGELIEFPGHVYGLVFNLEREMITAIILGRHTQVIEGATAKCTGYIMSTPVGEELIGRVINSLGKPIDGKGKINTKKYRPVEFTAPAVIEREPVTEPLQTGYKLIDALVPIGKGQRELIIGDRQTGKTAIAVDTILNQKNKNVICIYVATGQKASDISALVKTLESYDAMDYTIIVAAPASDAAALQYLAPFTGCAIAEDFMYNGKDVLIVYDDFSKHAKAYRMLSLLLRRPPGREAYPGDIFYLHARLLERAAKLSKEKGGGSMTALPIIETQAGDVSAYIPTNVISITDGQIFLESDLFNAGQRPAVNVGISVSRVGGRAQTKAMRKVAGRLRLDLAQFREKESFTTFAAELDKETRCQIARGKAISEILKQDKHKPMPLSDLIIILYAGVNGFLDNLSSQQIKAFEENLLALITQEYREIMVSIEKEKELTDQNEKALQSVIVKFKKDFIGEEK
ncbi:MAG: F0F1 ATP synthase subunit alpha [Candidatus Margulisbacteria bacterium]|nr:F0F1 ATP synthase subunit alpha [Candidatus Margulisiibacteriota bacterium]MBU1022236.1 F0F1 ATP synthase subunit alpha [Candidatus Margulisiibacteriota bacterium]MBU1729325.1 F0F1 ATP synthase subunit alpha [Candidatus Margulisiibacteriota bacterium]MBU1955598.1 F0F1 ATP synthase subunit alpha [Candidatus Margulisiibacteriota bacterium]